MIITQEIASWCGDVENAPDGAIGLLELCEQVVAILSEARLLIPTSLALASWVESGGRRRNESLRAPVTDGRLVRAFRDYVAREGLTGLPQDIIVRGRGVIYEPDGSERELRDPITVWAIPAGPATPAIWIRTYCDAWLPHGLAGDPQPERYALNAPRLEAALIRIEAELGLGLYAEHTKRALACGYRITNHHDADGEVWVPSYTEVGEP